MQQGQGLLTKGIYQFEDPSGSIIASRIPAGGAAEFLTSGIKTLKTENIPVLTRLANFALGFKSPLLAEVWFFSLSNFNGRRWGTRQSVISSIEGQPIPLKAFGTYSVRVLNPRKLHSTMIGTRPVYTVSDVEDYVQGEILEKVGLELSKLQFLSIQPPKEIMQALDAKIAMNLIGDQRQYLLYNAAKGLRGDGNSGQASQGQDPIQVMMGMMLSKGLMGEDYKAAEKTVGLVGNDQADQSAKPCGSCGSMNARASKFCAQCGSKL